jgi:carboxypeptidase D
LVQASYAFALALHAPLDVNWQQCNVGVFESPGDLSQGPAKDGVLQRVIEYTNNVFIGNGNLDMLISTNGTLLQIQNITWNGKQGFQNYPGQQLWVPPHPEYNQGALAGWGQAGYWGSERGLTFYQAQLAGHELSEYAPGVAYRMLEILLGRISNFSSSNGFTTQRNLTNQQPFKFH